MTHGGPEHQGSVPGLSPEQARGLAQRHGLDQLGVRPPLPRYLRDLWRHRHFLVTMSAADSVARHQNNYLGQLWSVLNPLLLGLAYFLIFGLLLDTRGDTQNFIGFLTIGLFTYLFMAAGFNYAAKSLVDNTALVRSLRFPRAILPVSTVLAELLASLPAFAILVVLALLTDETPAWKWLLFPVAIAVVGATTMGLGLITARLVHGARDLSNLIPLATRMLRYVSGIFFPVRYFAERVPGPDVIADILTYQPIAVLLTMVRETLLAEEPLRWQTWAFSSGWAVFFLVLGLVLFWRGEATYGRG